MTKKEERTHMWYVDSVDNWENYTDYFERKRQPKELNYQVRGKFLFQNYNNGNQESQTGFSHLTRPPLTNTKIIALIEDAQNDAWYEFNRTEEAGEAGRYETEPEEWFFIDTLEVEILVWRKRSIKRRPMNINSAVKPNKTLSKKQKIKVRIAEAEKKAKYAEQQRIIEYAKQKRKIKRQAKKKK